MVISWYLKYLGTIFPDLPGFNVQRSPSELYDLGGFPAGYRSPTASKLHSEEVRFGPLTLLVSETVKLNTSFVSFVL